MRLEVMVGYLQTIAADPKLTVWHMAILIAVIQLGFIQSEEKIIKVSRRKIMDMSHIATLPTYHKYFKELQILGYISYRPSYHPGYRSEVEILF